MKIQYCSDLHLEFKDNISFIKSNPILPKGDVLILAGDIMPFEYMTESFLKYLENLGTQYESVYWIPGNHEYYHSDISKRSGAFIEELVKKVFLINNKSIHIGGVELIFTTLWSKISDHNSGYIRRNMSDFHIITQNQEAFSPTHFNALHNESISFLNKTLANKKKGKRIVISHHVPTLKNYPPQYLGSKLNEGFAVGLDELIEESDIDYWIYGHSHANVHPFYLGNTLMLTNQLGYVAQGEHKSFDRSSVIEF